MLTTATLSNRKPRRRKCKACKEWFNPFQPNQIVCSPECAREYGSAINAKKRVKAQAKIQSEQKRHERDLKRRHKARKERLKTKGDWAREAQREFNRFIRERDWYQPCISCGRHHQGQYHAGHYRTVGANPELRFEESNCHRQCSACNNHLSGNITNYRINLIKKIGLDRVEWLEGPHEPKKYTIEDLKAIKEEYKQRANQLAGEGQ